jgi:hypothetical protein
MRAALFIAAAALLLGALAWLAWARVRWRARVVLGALLEQVRREENHHVRYRPDQRREAVRQRLRRHGLKGRRLERAVERALKDFER